MTKLISKNFRNKINHLKHEKFSAQLFIIHIPIRLNKPKGLPNVHKSNNGFSWNFPINVNEQVFINGQETSNIDRKGGFNLKNTGIQFGLNYTFGTLTFK